MMVGHLKEAANTLARKPHLHGAGHGAEGEHGGTVLNGGLAVKCSLSVHEEHGNLLRDTPDVKRCLLGGYRCSHRELHRPPCCRQACPPRRLRSRSEFPWFPSRSLLSRRTRSGARRHLPSTTRPVTQRERGRRRGQERKRGKKRSDEA